MDYYLTIIEKYLKNEISSSEKEILQEWIEKNLENKILFKKEVKNWYASKNEVQMDVNMAYERFMRSTDKKKARVIWLKPWLKVASYAAVLTGVLLGFYYYTATDVSDIKMNQSMVDEHTKPVDNIKIAQADGTIIYMDFDNKTDVVNTKGEVIGKKNEEALIISGNTSTEVEYLEISIPKGKLFQLALSDGTKVWLNADSKLKFPQRFVSSEKNRIVYLTGEAFFDVTTNKQQPFIVKAGGVDVEVLGTQFNVSSYAEDDTIKTTLVEGAVAINNPEKHTNMLRLTPSYQAVYNKQQKLLNKKKVNTALYTSWMHRKIMMQDEPFAEVIKRLERAYNVEIVSTNDKLNTTRFTGEFDIENVHQILNVFSETINFAYEMNENKILISSNN